MNIGPSQNTLHAIGNTLLETTPTAQSKVPTTAQTVAAPATNSTQRADAAPRPEAPVQPNQLTAPDSRDVSRQAPSGQDDHRAAKVDILV
ncbi:MAG: hypothetical protein ACR2QH_14975 [Geminicoccaceae bacterium]|jgi:hypothetical protein